MTVESLSVQLKVAECETAAWTPIPLRETRAGEFAALLVTVRLPAMVPVPDGSKVTLSVPVCPGARICPDCTPPAM